MIRYDAAETLLKRAAAAGIGGVAACLLALSGCAEGEVKAGLGPNENPVTSVVVSAGQSSISVGQAVMLYVEGRTASGQPAPVEVVWSASGGSVVTLSDSVASFSAATAGAYVVRATSVSSSSLIDSTTITVVAGTSPTVSVALAPGSASLATGGVQPFSVVATRQDGSTYQPSVTWSATGGNVTSGGVYTAGATAGTFRVVATLQGGALADTAAITLTAPVLQAVVLTPSSVSLATGATQLFLVSGQWSNGATTAPAVTYSATGGTVTSGGLYTAGSTAGTFRVIATQQGGTLADTAMVVLTSGSGAAVCVAGVAGVYPNQPAGMTRFFEHDFAAIPNGSNGAAGSNWLVEAGGSLLSIVTGSAPSGDANCLRTRFPNGQSSGEAPVNLTVDMSDAVGPRRTSQYFSLWFMVEGANFENQAVGTKFGFFGYGDTDSGALNQSFLILEGAGTQQIMSAMNLELWQQGSIADRTLGRNVGSGSAVTAGVWLHLEMVMVDNTVGSSNGEFHMWINGVKTHQYTNVVYRNSSMPRGFRGWKWDPTWGGIGGTKTRDDYIRFAHVYMSGN